jgi:hypothetical protein
VSIFSATVDISDYDVYRRQVNAFTKKGIDEAEAPDGVVNTITKLIDAKEPKFSNPVRQDDRYDPLFAKLCPQNV